MRTIGTPIVIEVKTQYRVSNITAQDAILDVLAEDGDGRLINVEIQRTDTVSHARRTRLYGSMIDSKYLQKGKTYNEMPDVHIIYISLTDLWNAGKTVYRVKKVFDGTDVVYDDGMNILYVNAAVNDGSDTAKLMAYFKTTDPEDMSQGELSKRVYFLKREEGGYAEMSEAAEKWYREGEMKKAKETAYELYKEGGFIPEEIAKRLKVNEANVRHWLEERPSAT